MKLRNLLALYAGTALVTAAPTVLAGDGDHKDGDEMAAVQVKVDDDGHMVEGEDDAVRVTTLRAVASRAAAAGNRVADSGRNSNVSVMMGNSAEPQQYHADGSVSVRLGLDSLNFLAVKIDEDGNPIYMHVDSEDTDLDAAADEIAKGEQ